ncbi:MAG: DUF4442 domain-containing protein [Myxococcales bacterium]|nr:DUF4442 domain-containing protein [Myxococcales bacterium]
MAKRELLDLASVRGHWERISAVPGGKALFSKAMGLFVPYTATIDPRIEEIRPGHARVRMRDRRAVRNHLRSIHAVALVNLAELAGNLSLIAGLPNRARLIVTGLSIDYLKKARGPIAAVADAPPIATAERKEVEADIRLENGAGEVVARAKLRCLVGPKA